MDRTKYACEQCTVVDQQPKNMCEDGCSFTKRLWMYEWSVGKGRDSYERHAAVAGQLVNM